MSQTTYTIFIGSWDAGDPDWTHLRTKGLSWEAARDLLIQRLDRWKDDECDQCRADAAEGLDRLLSAAPGRFETEVEGEDYMIIPKDDPEMKKAAEPEGPAAKSNRESNGA